MKFTTMRGAVCGFCLLLSIAPVQAQFAIPFQPQPQVVGQENKWATDMFEKLSHDFGVVARGADTRYRLAITNKWQQSVHISAVRTSCGCTAAKPSQELLTGGQAAYIEITMDTRKFTHLKESSITVVFDAPLFAEVKIPIKAYIRTDVVLTPGSAEFGPIPKGVESVRKIAVDYAGREDWAIREVINKNPNLDVKFVQTSRGGGRVSYDLTVAVKATTPPGDLRDQIALVTDDANSPHIPVMIEAKVEAEYTVNPEVVSFGVLAPGEKRLMNVVVRGRKPFSIDKIESEKTAGAFEVRLPQEPRLIHVLPLSVTAPSQPGMLEELFTVTINGTPNALQFKAYGKIVAPAGGVPAASTPAAVPVVVPGQTAVPGL